MHGRRVCHSPMSFEVQGIILVSADDLNEGKSEYARFGKVGLTVM